MHTIPLSAHWQLKQRTPDTALEADFAAADGWLAAAVPGSTHEALIAAGRIPDPFIGTNEQDVQWIGEQDWLYRCTFEVAAETLSQPQIDLCFDGLDTFAAVWLNGERVASSDNMFVPLRRPVASKLRAGANTVQIVFESVLRHGQARQAEGGVRAVWTDGDSSRVYVRKAQYHYGWDWGPTLLTSGVWREARLEAYTARISDLHAPAEVATDLATAIIPVVVTTEGATTTPFAARIDLIDPNGEMLESATVPVMQSVARHTFTINQPVLWWPHSHGAQPRYQVVATLLATDGGRQIADDSEQSILDSRSVRLGLRRLRLIQEPIVGEVGSSFYFEINNVPLFVGGANWIPDDIPTTRVTPERYQAQIARAVAANMTMLRIWGGGIYEAEAFYEACDEQGILIWQDFLFACGMYPTSAWLLESVRQEAEAQVRRLRHHPCIALWCGNNEDYSIASDRFQPNQTPEENTAFPARVIYERLLPAVCAQADGTRFYWPGSPYGGAWSDDPTVGDTHVWSVWHQDMRPYQDYPQLAGRFVSEFGMAAFPALATIHEFAAGETAPDSAVIQFHQKAESGQRRMTHYMRENFGVPEDLPHFSYISQLNQAEALTYAFTGWRRRWGNPGQRATGGALVWQFNDDWPTMSWAVIDYALRPKAAYYAVKRALAPLAIGIERAGERLGVWIVNGTLADVAAEVALDVWALNGTAISQRNQAVTIAANSVLELNLLPELTNEQIVAARLILNGEAVARFAAWPEPFTALALPNPEIVIEATGPDHIRISAKRPAKGVWLTAGDQREWSDNGFDLMPTDARIIYAPGVNVDAVVAAGL